MCDLVFLDEKTEDEALQYCPDTYAGNPLKYKGHVVQSANAKAYTFQLQYVGLDDL